MSDPSADPGVGADEQRLLDDLARLVRERDPVPAELLEAARQGFTWRTVDAELAELVADSEQPEGAALIRSTTASVRLLAFATGDMRLDLEVLAEGPLRRLVGELDPGGPARVLVEHAGGTLTEDTDDFGRFLVSRVPGGLVRLRCQPRSGRPLLTPWLTV
jgi:hypothetical protein